MKLVLAMVLMLIVFNGVFVFSGGLTRLQKVSDVSEVPIRVKADIVDVFRFTLEDEVRKKRGQPIEGFVPNMFLEAFPGLVASDFDGVEASIGYYQMVEGKLSHQLGQPALVHSAAGVVSQEGIVTLLKNVTKRLGIDLQATGTITEVITALVSKTS